MRRIALILGVVLIFIRVGMVAQILGRTLGGINLRLMYVVGVPALLGVVLAGGFQRSLKSKVARLYLGVGLWMVLAVPFSTWKGGSLTMVMTFWRADFMMLFIAAGLALTWRECILFIRAVVAAAFVNMLSAGLFANENRFGYREGLDFGDISNPNDFAGHLLFVLPFLFWIVLSSKNIAVRLLAMAGIAVGFRLILGTASRGALIGIAVAAAVFLWRGTVRQRVALLVIGPLLAIAIPVFVSPEAMRRIVSFSSSEQSMTPEETEAVQSSSARQYLLKKSLEYMWAFPIFGVGPGQFASYEGEHTTVLGTHGYWHSTHNSFTQVGSECGLPAGLMLVAGVLSTFVLLNRSWRLAAQRADCKDIRDAAFCVMLSAAGFSVAGTFLNMGYHFYFPLLAGFAILIDRTARVEIRQREIAAAARTPLPVTRARDFF